MTSRVFGCTCFVQDLSHVLDKLSPRSIKCIFVGHYRTQKGYRCYNPSTRKYFMFAESHYLSLFNISPHNILLLSLKLFLFHCLCHWLHHYLHLLLMIPCQCHWYTLRSHLHWNQFGISDTSTLIAKRFLPLNQLADPSSRWSSSPISIFL